MKLQAESGRLPTRACSKCGATSAVEALNVCSASSEVECQGLLLWSPDCFARVGRVESGKAPDS